jgi:hypothetical protein
MGKKKSQQHVAESMGQMVSRAALSQLMKPISQMIQIQVNQLGQKLAFKQAENTAMMFTRIVATEKLLIEKGIVTQDELQNKVADIEDERDNATKADVLEKGDIARIEVRTKDVKAKDFEDGTTKFKVMNFGSGSTLGTEVETAALGMKVGELRIVTFADNTLNAEITLARVSRPIPPPAPPVVEAKEQPAATEAPAEAAPTQETADASADQVQG